MPRRFEGSRVFITGASSGIGAAVAEAFAAEGARVALAARRTSRLQELRKKIIADGGDAMAVTCDVTDPASIKRAVARTVKIFGGLDVALANAGFVVKGPLAKLTTEDYRRQFDTNFFGVIDTVYAVLPHLKQSKGRLGITSSIAGIVTTPKLSAYCASKHAVSGLAEALYYELDPVGVSVTLISPGYVASEIGKVNNHGEYDTEQDDMVPAWLAASVERTARAILDAFHARRFDAVVTIHGKIAATVGRHFPGLVRTAQRLTPPAVKRDLGI